MLDLAAGTGAVTRELAGRAQRIIAVEPDERMRAVLTASCLGAEVLARRRRGHPVAGRVGGRGGDLGRLALAGSGPGRAGDHPRAARGRGAGRDLGVPGRAGALGGGVQPAGPRIAGGDGQAESRAGGQPDGRLAPAGRQVAPAVTFPPGTAMSPAQERTVEYSLPMTKDDLLGLLGTYSSVITLEPERRAAFTRRVQAYLDRQPWERVDLPMICRCLRSTRDCPASSAGPQAAVDEPDQPPEALVRIGVPLEPAGGLQDRESVQRAADSAQGMVHLLRADAVAA